MKYAGFGLLEDKLHPDEPWFVLRGQDLLAPHAIEVYSSLVRAAASGQSNVELRNSLLALAHECERVASAMVHWQATHSDHVKLPD